jgi:hypothetical protein
MFSFARPVGIVLVCLVTASLVGLLAVPHLHAQERADKRATAVRVPIGTIDVDGRLNDEAWATLRPLTDFVQREPVEGAPATDRMEVRLAYDDNALYIGARMFTSTPIQAPMGRRDSGNQAEHIRVLLDTYLDRRTAFSFGVTATGVRLDQYFSGDFRWAGDSDFDPVWQAQTTIDTEGWSAELWIPFAQLRFSDIPAQLWGFNIQRWVPSRNEEVFWSLVPRTENRFVSLFGTLDGIAGIQPSRRLELLPYVAGSSHVIGDRDHNDPFTSAANLAALGSTRRWDSAPTSRWMRQSTRISAKSRPIRRRSTSRRSRPSSRSAGRSFSKGTSCSPAA